MRRALRHRRRQGLAAGLALVATAVAIASARGEDGDPGSASASPPRSRPPSSVEMVSAPVRIADAETVRLLRPGDRLDVIAVPDAPVGRQGEQPAAKVVAAGARVTKVPTVFDDAGAGDGDGGALIVLSVPRSTATALAGASGASRLAVTLW
ncbi:hypothetical protein ABZ348_17390 [Streptomyces sp. NPDC005963]|uniref:RcpC/CpaB family pilus assembly protein n=1 Tax=Streptomyces sp. NPDC005963 TaxID=3156721 RepID=UPI0033FC5599